MNLIELVCLKRKTINRNKVSANFLSLGFALSADKNSVAANIDKKSSLLAEAVMGQATHKALEQSGSPPHVLRPTASCSLGEQYRIEQQIVSNYDSGKFEPVRGSTPLILFALWSLKIFTFYQSDLCFEGTQKSEQTFCTLIWICDSLVSREYNREQMPLMQQLLVTVLFPFHISFSILNKTNLFLWKVQWHILMEVILLRSNDTPWNAHTKHRVTRWGEIPKTVWILVLRSIWLENFRVFIVKLTKTEEFYMSASHTIAFQHTDRKASSWMNCLDSCFANSQRITNFRIWHRQRLVAFASADVSALQLFETKF